MRVVLDTNVLVSALKSVNGASHALLRSLPNEKFETVLSVPLYFEYLDVLKRPAMVPASFTTDEIDAICRFLASISHLQEIFFLWRPLLNDAKDEMVVELAVASSSEYIITHNLRDFEPAASFGVRAVSPGQFLEIIDETS